MREEEKREQGKEGGKKRRKERWRNGQEEKALKE